MNEEIKVREITEEAGEISLINDSLQKEIDILREAFSELVMKINPVLINTLTNNSECNLEEVYLQTALGVSLQERRDKIKNLRFYVEEVTNRVSL
jgi:hypothetical protein